MLCTKTIISVFLIAQDGNEMYVANAIVETGYTEHMKDEKKTPVKKEELVRIEQYGPYQTHEKQDMEYFAKLVLALALRASEEDAMTSTS